MKRIMIWLTVLMMVFSVSAQVLAELSAGDQKGDAKDIKLQTTCPVMGGKIDKSAYVDYEGRRIYMCCKGCESALKKDPAKYIKKLKDDGVTVAKIQTKCPVMGGDINKKLYVDSDGKRIYMCCKGCEGALKKDPAKYIKKLEAEGVVLDASASSGKKK